MRCWHLFFSRAQCRYLHLVVFMLTVPFSHPPSICCSFNLFCYFLQNGKKQSHHSPSKNPGSFGRQYFCDRDFASAYFKSYSLKIQQFLGATEAEHLRNISIVQITLYASSLFGRWHGVTVIDGVGLLFPQLCTWNSFAHHSSHFPCPADTLRAL